MLLHSSEDLYAVFHPGESDFLLITFGFNGMAADDSNFWGKAFCTSAKLNAVGFMSRRSDWFPAAAMEPAIADVLKEIGRFNRRLTYGSSMGGFGAIRYAKELGAQATLAYAPQYSIDPAKIGHFDPNFSEMFDPTKNADMEPDGQRHVAEQAFILYDPDHPKDRAHVELIKQAAPQAILVGLRHTGHAVGSVFASTSKALKLIRAAASFDEAGVRRIATAERRTAPIRTAYLAASALSKHPKWSANLVLAYGGTFPEAILKSVQSGLRLRAGINARQRPDDDSSSLFLRAAQAQFGNSYEMLKAAKLLAVEGKKKEALVALKDLLSQAPKFTDGLALFSNLLMQEGRFEEAAPVARRWAELEMDNPNAHQRHASAEERAGRPIEALEAAKRAVSYAPTDAGMRDMLAGLLQRQGAFAEALEVARKAVVLNEASLPAQMRLSNLAAQQGDAVTALAAAQKVVDIGGAKALTLRTLALRYHAMGNRSEALDTIRLALNMEPENTDLLRQEAFIRSQPSTSKIN